jgi:transposase, IS30 family
VTSSRLHDAVNEGLEQKWSPEQISARLDEEYPDDPEMKVSHETIYQTLYLQAKGELRTELKLALRGPGEASTPIPGGPEQGKDPRHGQHQ